MYPGLQGTTEDDNLGKMAIYTPDWKQGREELQWAERAGCKAPRDASAKISIAVPRWMWATGCTCQHSGHNSMGAAVSSPSEGCPAVLRFLPVCAASYSKEEVKAVQPAVPWCTRAWAKRHLKPISKLRICPLLWGVLSCQSINAK